MTKSSASLNCNYSSQQPNSRQETWGYFNRWGIGTITESFPIFIHYKMILNWITPNGICKESYHKKYSGSKHMQFIFKTQEEIKVYKMKAII